MHGHSVGGQRGEGHWRQGKRDQVCQVWGTARVLQVGSRSVCSGEERRGEETGLETQVGLHHEGPAKTSRECGLDPGAVGGLHLSQVWVGERSPVAL